MFMNIIPHKNLSEKKEVGKEEREKNAKEMSGLLA
jgi:hypothetical protein